MNSSIDSNSQIKKELDSLFTKASHYLSFRSRTKKEVFDNLKAFSEKSNFSDTDINTVIKTLEEKNYINDENFIREFVDSYSRNKPKSRFAIEFALLKKGVPRELTSEFFENFDIDEPSLAIRALSQKWRQFSQLDDRKKISKSTNFLRNRGFSYEVVKRAIEELDKKE